MKLLKILFLVLPFTLLAQQKVVKTIEITTSVIELVTFELDNIQIENIEGNKVEIVLLNEDPKSHSISIEKENSLTRIGFRNEEELNKDEIFRKYITKRLNRANAIIRIPKNKEVLVYGKHIDIISKDYKGDLKIFIDKGEIHLNKLEGNLELKLFLGNVFAKCLNANIEAISNNGKILVNQKEYSKTYSKKAAKSTKEVKIESVDANINLTTL